MEKQHQYQNFSMFNHLPKILNMMQIMNMMVYGFVVNQPMYFVMAISNLQKSIRPNPALKLRKRLQRLLNFRFRIAYYVTLTLNAFMVAASHFATANVLFFMASFVSLALVTQLFFIYKNMLPFSKLVRSTCLSRAPFINYSNKLICNYQRYKIADLLGLLCLGLATIY